MNYKQSFDPIRNVRYLFKDETPKIPFFESTFNDDFPHIKDSCQSILEFYQNGNGLILPVIEELNLFFEDNIDDLLKVDISPITDLYKEIGFDVFILDIFDGSVSHDILDAFILHFCIILDFSEFQSIYKSHENFPCVYKLFLEYEGEKSEALLFCVLKYFNCQNLYESAYISLFEDFISLSQKIFDILQAPFANYLLTDSIVSSVSSKETSSMLDPNIISNVISYYPDIIHSLPIFDDEDFNCLKIFYHICKKMVKTDCVNVIKLLLQTSKLDILLSTPLEDSDILKKGRIDFLRICLSCLHNTLDKKNLLAKSKEFDFAMIIQCSQSDSNILIEASLKFLSSFLPDLIDELNEKYSSESIIDFVKDILAKGQFSEKKESIDFITSLIENKNYVFIRQLLKIEDMDEEEDDENIFVCFSNIMQTDFDDLKVKILNMIDILYQCFENSAYQKLRDDLTYSLIKSHLDDDIESHSESDNVEISKLSSGIMEHLIYYSNLPNNNNF